MNKPYDLILADDHALIRHGLRKVIEADGAYRVFAEAEDGREVVELVRSMPTDIVIMDIGMAGLNGIDACRQIVKHSPRTRVVAVSAFSDRRHVNEMLEAGAVAYVAKASAADELMRALTAVIAGRKYLSPEVTDAVVDHLTGRHDDRPDPLAPREREVLQLLAEGQTSGEIAAALNIATATVETHRRNLMKKLDLHSVAELTKYAIREGLTPLEE